jgi:DNA polymerase elongation subunit (family B)
MLRDFPLNDILFIDIETIPAYPNFEAAPEIEKRLWRKKSGSLFREERSPDETYERAGIYAEFGRVICISCGRIRSKPDSNDIRLDIRSFAGENEHTILQNFSNFLSKHKSKLLRLCAHNGKEFDFPYLSRRMLINGIPLPKTLDNAGKKPWEIQHFDTLELWKFGDYKHYTSLELLAYCFRLPSPKDSLDGSIVAKTWYVDKNLSAIQNYCEADVSTLVHVFLKMSMQKMDAQVTVEYQR